MHTGSRDPLGHELDSPWGRLRSRFLASLGPAEQAHIYNLSVHTASALRAWAERQPMVRAERIAPLSLSVAAGAPFSSIGALVSTARLSLWVFALDDFFDEGGASDVELRRQADELERVARQQLAGPTSGHLAPPLREVVEDLTGYPLFELIGDRWAAALSGTVDGMLRENDWRLSLRRTPADWRSLPSYEEYVATGLYSIGGPPHMWAATITADDPSTPDHLEHLSAMEQLASSCIRLANDLQSYHKELAEGSINGLVILSHDLVERGLSPDAALEQARQRVQSDIAAGLERLSGLRESAVTRTGQPEAAMDNIARFVCDFYAHHDYHTFVTQAA